MGRANVNGGYSVERPAPSRTRQSLNASHIETSVARVPPEPAMRSGDNGANGWVCARDQIAYLSAWCRIPLLALRGREDGAERFPLLGVKRK